MLRTGKIPGCGKKWKQFHTFPLEIKKSEEIVYEMEQSFKLGCLHAKPGERMW